MNFENQVNRSEAPSSPTKRLWTVDSPKSVTAAALDSMQKSLSNIKLSPRKEDRSSRSNAPSPSSSPTREAGYVGSSRLAVDRSPTRTGISGLPVRKPMNSTDAGQAGIVPRNFEIEVLRELTEDEMAIIKSRESKRLVTVSQLCKSPVIVWCLV